MDYSPMLAPVVALVAWTLVIMVWMARRALRGDFEALGITCGNIPRRSRGANLEGKAPDEAQWKSHNYNHLMEQPTIFYAIALTLALMGMDGGINVWLAWGYVGLRIVHSLIQCDGQHRALPLPVFALAIALPARPDGPRRRAHPARLLACTLAAEGGRQLDMGRPAELADRPHPVEPVAAVDQQFGVAGEGRRIAADIGDARHGRGGELRDLLLAPARGGSSTTASNAASSLGIERPAVEVAMLDERSPARRRLERQHRVARRLGGSRPGRPAPARRCRGREQVGDRAALADRLAHRRDQRRLAVRGRLKEGADGKRDRHARQGDRRRLRLVARLGPKPSSMLSRARPLVSQKAVSASTASRPSASTPFSSTSTPWSASVSWTSAVALAAAAASPSSARSGATSANSSGRRIWHSRMSTMRCDFAALKPMHRARPPSAPAGVARRRVRGGDRCGGADLGRQAVLRQRAGDPRDADSRDRPRRRHAGAGSRRIRESDGMAAPGGAGPARALPSSSSGRPGPRTATWRPLAVTPSPRAAMRTIGSLTGGERGGNGRDQIVGDHRRPGDLGGAAVQPDRGAGGLERRHARAPAARRSSRRARRRCRRWPARPAPAARSRAGRRAPRPACPGPCRRPPRPIAAPPRARARPCCPRARRTARTNSPSCGVRIASWPLSRSGSPTWPMASASITIGRLRRQRQRQHLRDVAHARARPAGSRSARR